MAGTWKCDVCGYVHKGGKPPETCPVCGVSEKDFSSLDVDAPPAADATYAWRCRICGYEHSGETPPLKCPLCGAGPEYFVGKEESPHVSSHAAPKIVIVGGGIAAVTAAESARETSKDAEITLL